MILQGMIFQIINYFITLIIIIIVKIDMIFR